MLHNLHFFLVFIAKKIDTNFQRSKFCVTIIPPQEIFILCSSNWWSVKSVTRTRTGN